MPKFNAISLATENIKFSAKYPAPEKQSKDNPLQGYFNYIHAVPLLESQSKQLGSNPSLVKALIEQFHTQQLAAAKIKFALVNKTAKPAKPLNNLKYSGQLDSVAINHDNFRADQIVGGSGNSQETLQYSVRVRADKMDDTLREKLSREVFNPNSNVIKNMEQGIRKAVGAGQALEIGIQNAERALAPAVAEIPGNFDLKIKLKRAQLFSNTAVVVSSAYYNADRGLLKNPALARIDVNAALPEHYTPLP